MQIFVRRTHLITSFFGVYFRTAQDSDVESVAVEPGADPGILKRGGRVLSF